MKLSRVERWMLVNQMRILEALYPDEAKSIAEHRQALEEGYELHYNEFAQHICDDEDTLSVEGCKEVLYILSMHQALKRAFDELPDKSGIEEYRVRFVGFDGNDRVEGTMMAYTRWSCDSHGGRFKDLDRGDDFNSHGRMLDSYRAMLKEWEKSKDKNRLTKDDIIRITSAR
jgi:uncharacterized protein YfbU (UPF0304 family)